jgi:hypothetical protein
MSLRWLVAACVLGASGCALLAADDGVIGTVTIDPGADDVPVMKAIPVLTSQDASSANANITATVGAPTFVRAEDAAGALADSTNEFIDIGWHMALSKAFSIGYDEGVNAFRQDQTIWDDDEATSNVTSALINKGSLTMKSGSNISVTGYAQEQETMSDDTTGYGTGTKYGGDVSWAPYKDVTTVKVDASTAQTYNFDHSLMDEDLYTGSLDQKLPWMPLTLHTAGSITQDDYPVLEANDKANTIEDVSLLWKAVESTSLSGGVQRQQSAVPASVQLANTDVYFTQVSLQTTQTVAVTVRAAREQTDTTQNGAFLSSGSDLLLTFGLNWYLGDRFNLGAGVNYRTLENSTSAQPVNGPPASVSISAGGHF